MSVVSCMGIVVLGCGDHHNIMIKAIVRRGYALPVHLQRFHFGGGHATKPYDWRDDHALNPYYEEDPRRRHIPDSYAYGQPYESAPSKPIPTFPDNYNPKDLTQNFVGSRESYDMTEHNLLEPHHQNVWDDIAHEWDYESEDLDFQPETFHSQHFRKKGMIWPWFGVALIPYWLVIQEVIYHQMVDGDQNKYQRPPPLNYPDEEDTPDTETYELWKSEEFTYLHDAGILRDPYRMEYLGSSRLSTGRRFITSGRESTSREWPSRATPPSDDSANIINHPIHYTPTIHNHD